METAFALLTVVPLVIVFMRVERYVVQGITTGAVKSTGGAQSTVVPPAAAKTRS